MVNQFRGFSEDQMKRIAQKLGYGGPMNKFNEFLASNPGAQQAFSGLENKAKMRFAQGGFVQNSMNMQVGGYVAPEALQQTPGTVQLQTAPVPVQQQYGAPVTDPTTGEVMKQEVMRPPENDFERFGIDTSKFQSFSDKVAGAKSTGGTLTYEVGQDQKGIYGSSSAMTGTNADTVRAMLRIFDQYKAKSGNKNITPKIQVTYGANSNQFDLIVDGSNVGKFTNTMQGMNEAGQALLNKFNTDYGMLETQAAIGTGEFQERTPNIVDYTMQQLYQPGLPAGAIQTATGLAETTDQIISDDTGQAGAVTQASAPADAVTAQATTPTEVDASTYTAKEVTDQLTATEAATGDVRPEAIVQAETMDPATTAVAEQEAAQLDSSVRIQPPEALQVSPEQLVSKAADARVAAQFAEEVEAAQAQPSERTTVQGQLANLMADFEGDEPPAWAAGAMRNATAIMAQRGLAASSMAGQAIVQAAMESAIPIATQDAQTMAQFELQNLSNRQARAMLAAQQRAQFIGQEFDQEFQARVANAARISDIADINFNAEQQIALENARLAQTVDLENLNNRQAIVMANVAQISALETQNLNNRQQAAVQNAQSFLQMDMANLANEQQAVMFDAQSRVQTLLSDQAAINASRQFNAQSEQQNDQFFANLKSQVSQFNATQKNAMEQFNIEQDTAINMFNAEQQNARDQFNAQNELIVAQSNAQWRRDIATFNTSAINEANKANAEAVLGLNEQAYANLWQAYEDEMEYAWRGGQNELDRINEMAMQRLAADANLSMADAKRDAANASSLGQFAATAVFGVPGASAWQGLLNL